MAKAATDSCLPLTLEQTEASVPRTTKAASDGCLPLILQQIEPQQFLGNTEGDFPRVADETKELAIIIEDFNDIEVLPEHVPRALSASVSVAASGSLGPAPQSRSSTHGGVKVVPELAPRAASVSFSIASSGSLGAEPQSRTSTCDGVQTGSRIAVDGRVVDAEISRSSTAETYTSITSTMSSLPSLGSLPQILPQSSRARQLRNAEQVRELLQKCSENPEFIRERVTGLRSAMSLQRNSANGGYPPVQFVSAIPQKEFLDPDEDEDDGQLSQ